MEVTPSDVLWLVRIRGTLLAPLMARNSLKSNVTWTSYPFVPPTGTSGFFADVVGGMKWYETNDGHVRHLYEHPDYQGVYGLGAYPTYGQLSKRHYRAHLGSLAFSYEAHVWTAGRNEGKKLAVIEEFLGEELEFMVAAHDPEPLRRLQSAVRGQVAPIAKKGSIQLEFSAEPSLTRLERQLASGIERTLAVMPVAEIGSLPMGLVPYLVPLRSEEAGRGIRWHSQHCVWHRQLNFRAGVPIYGANGVGVSCGLLETVAGVNLTA